MPGLLTEITEIVTALGMTGVEDLPSALADIPECLTNVSESVLDGIRAAQRDGAHTAEFRAAWENGRAFFESTDGLRGRVPRLIEWKGPHRQPGYDNLPVDLRVDHVYLVSCKYASRILANSSPTNLFHRRLLERTVELSSTSWYESVAPAEFEHFYGLVRSVVGESRLPVDHGDLDETQKGLIRQVCGRAWPEPLVDPWAELSLAVAEESARRWNLTLDSASRREEMLWRLLRLGPAPYFVLGTSAQGPMRLRIATPWDWRQRFGLQDLRIAAVPTGQPVVGWRAAVVDRDTGDVCRVDGHVEIRWAHGRFSTVEAKVYLDTPHERVPGYFPLDDRAQSFDYFNADLPDDGQGQLSLWPSDDDDDVEFY